MCGRDVWNGERVQAHAPDVTAVRPNAKSTRLGESHSRVRDGDIVKQKGCFSET